MQNEWPTQTLDMQAATAIIDRHTDMNDGEPLGLIEVVIDKKKNKLVEVRMPEWIREVIAYFRVEYGREQGQIVAGKVITRVLLKDETIH